MVTGAGGSIGSSFAARSPGSSLPRLMLSGELSLHAIASARTRTQQFGLRWSATSRIESASKSDAPVRARNRLPCGGAWHVPLMEENP